MIKLTDGDNTSAQNYLGYALAMSGKRREALWILTQLQRGNEYVSPVELAVLWFGLGDKNKALTSLENAYAEHDLQMQFLKSEPHFDSLRSDPRFTDLVHKVGFTP